MRFVFLLTVLVGTLVLGHAQASGQSVRFERLSIDQGLSQGTILGITQDKQGFIWIATYDGLNRFDGYQFKHYRHDSEIPGTISGSSISAIFVDSKGVLWVGTDETGLNRFNRTTETFEQFFHDPQDPNSISENFIAAIAEDDNGRIWVATRNQGVNLFDEKKGHFIRFKHQQDDKLSLSKNLINKMHADKQGRIWLTTDGGGLNRYDEKLGGFVRYRHDENDSESLSHDKLYGLHADDKGFLWVGSEAGLNRMDIKTGKVKRYQHDKDDPNSLNHNSVWTILEDAQGTIWAGTDGGIGKLDQTSGQFMRIEHHPPDIHSLAHNAVLSSFLDRDGVLWFGTAGGGVNKLDPLKMRFGHFKHSGPGSLSGNLVMSFYQDKQKNLWIGADSEGLNRIDHKTGEITVFRHDSEAPASIGSDRIWSIAPAKEGKLWLGTFGRGVELFDPVEGKVLKRFRSDPDDEYTLSGDWIYKLIVDSKGRLWVGSGDGGLSRYNEATDTFTRFAHDPNDPNSISSNMVISLLEDSQGRFWVATEGGINRFDGQNNQFTRYQTDKNNPNSIARNFAISATEDAKGTLWFGTVGGGLSRYNEEQDNFNNYGLKQGLPNEIVYGIVEDPEGFLWLSTNKGLSHFDTENERFRNYDVHDGLQSDEFNGNAYYKSPEGELFFGGINGFNRFFAAAIEDNKKPPEVVFTDFMLFNRSVPLGKSSKKTFALPVAINELDALELNHRQNLLSFEFAALMYHSQSKIRYQYKLEGFDEDWLDGDARFRRATYTNLPAGSYTMRVRAANPEGVWSNKDAQINLTVLPAPWFSLWAFALYFVLIASSIYAYINHRINANKMRNELKLMDTLKQLDKLKDAFLANTSHELRTPLNGIIGLAESMLDGNAGKLSPKAHHELAMIATSGKRLANLVNDILDLSKLKEHNIELNRQPLDLRLLTDTVLSLSKPMAQDKGIALKNAIPEDMVTVDADENRLLQVLHNLVGNAVKFTDKGSVTVTAQREYDEVHIQIIDTGIGIAPDKLSRIFESFEQVISDDDRVHGGTGLGLTISKQLLQLHNSKIEVESTPGQGSVFSFRLSASGDNPVNKAHLAETLVLEQVDEEDIVVEQTIDGSRFRILIVDDEPINRQVLNNHLAAHQYHTVEAQDGFTALEILQTQGPFDMVLLDVMMPNMSGLEVCKKIRENHSVSELPVIFLTAKNQVQDVVEGFSVGANDHIAKPVSKQELLSRVSTHLQLLDVNRNLDNIVVERTEQINLQQKKLVLSEKLAVLGTLMAGVAHEINNPTNFVHVSVQNLEVDLEKFKQFIFELAGDDADEEILQSFRDQFKPLEQHIATIQDGTDRIKGIVKDFKTATHLEESDKKQVQVCDILASTMNLFATQYKRQIELVEDFHDSPSIECYPSKINQVLMNLLVNAGDAILEQDDNNHSGKIVVGCLKSEQYVLITVSDNGPGMAQETKEHLFEPFFTTKDIDHGTGLGLSISYDIVQKHNGEILVDSVPGEGTTFTVKLPLS